MIICIEGCDGAGKSKLASILVKQTGFKIVHMKRPVTEEEKNNMFNDYLSMIENNDNLIFDRCWYSEMVYGTVMRNKSYIDGDNMYKLEGALLKKGALIIYATSYIDKLWNNCLVRGEDYVTDFDTFKQLYDEFENVLFVHKHLIPVLKYDIRH